MRTPVSLPARARLRFALLAFLVATSACDNSSEPDLLPAPEFRACVDYGDHMRITGSVPLQGRPYDMLIAGSHLYVALANKVQILELGDHSPIPVSSVDVRAMALAMADDSRLCAAESRGFSVIDVRDPAAPVVQSTTRLPVFIEGIAAQGNYAYLAASEHGLWVADISLTQPRVIGSVDTPYRARTVALSGTIALVPCGSDYDSPQSLQMIDVSNATSPHRLGSLDGVAGSSISIEGHTAFLCGVAFESYAVDVTNPSAPLLLEVFPRSATDMVTDGDRIYTCGSRFAAYSVVNPALPVLLGTIETWAETMALHEDRVYLARGEGYEGGRVDIVDVTNPRPPQPLARLGFQRWTWRMSIQDQLLYLCAHDDLFLFDVSNQMPSLVQSIPIRAFDIALDDSAHAYVASIEDGLTILKLDTAGFATTSGQLNLPGEAMGIAIAQKRAYVALGNYGLWLVDVEDASHCRVIGSVDTPGRAVDVVIRDSFAYVADGDALIAIDTSEPGSPRIANSAGYPLREISAVALSGDYAYVVALEGLGVFDISLPGKPDFVASLDTRRGGRDIAIDGDIAYLAGASVTVVDIKDPRSPAVIGSAPVTYTGHGIALDGTRVFVSEEGALTIYPSQCE